MSDVHTQQFQTVQQVAATIDALTQRLSDLRQLADFMSKSEVMAAELAAHRQVAAVAPEQPRVSDLLRRLPQEGVTCDSRATAGTVVELDPRAGGPLSPETIRRTRKTGGGQ